MVNQLHLTARETEWQRLRFGPPDWAFKDVSLTDQPIRPTFWQADQKQMFHEYVRVCLSDLVR